MGREQGRRRQHHHRMTVGRRPRHLGGRDRARGTGTVLHHHRLAEELAELVFNADATPNRSACSVGPGPRIDRLRTETPAPDSRCQSSSSTVPDDQTVETSRSRPVRSNSDTGAVIRDAPGSDENSAASASAIGAESRGGAPNREPLAVRSGTPARARAWSGDRTRLLCDAVVPSVAAARSVPRAVEELRRRYAGPEKRRQQLRARPPAQFVRRSSAAARRDRPRGRGWSCSVRRRTGRDAR